MAKCAKKKNSPLAKAKKKKDDEYYTRYEDIQAELNHYEAHFDGKTVLCNCDDPYESNFCKFFLRNFNHLRLKRLICTSYISSPVAGTQFSLFDLDDEKVHKGQGYVMDISSVPMENGRGVSDEDITRLLVSKHRGVKKLNGNGDFRSAECLNYLEQADIVVTNPPFSLFREYISLLISKNKRFVIIGNENAIKCKEVFPMLKNNSIWLGITSPKVFNRPNGKVKEFGNVVWFTNLDIKQRHDFLDLYKRYTSDNYPAFDELPDVIMVDKVENIPCDYFGYMAVPYGTFFKYYNPEQFEVLDMLNRYTVLDYFGVNADVKNRHSHCCNIDGDAKFSRVVIRRKPKDEQS